jgi:hypothetical protein
MSARIFQPAVLKVVDALQPTQFNLFQCTGVSDAEVRSSRMAMPKLQILR